MNTRWLPADGVHRSPLWLLVALLLLSCCLHLSGITRESLWRDEVDSIRFAADIWRSLSESETVPAAIRELTAFLTRPGWNGPLYFWSLEPWLLLAGRSELALRLPSALAGVAVVALAYTLATHLLGSLAGRLTALLAAVNPYLAWYAGEGKMYTLITAMALLSTYLLLRACASARKRLWLGYVVVTTLLFYTHILTPLLLPVQAVLVLLLYPRSVRSAAAWISAALLTVPYLPLFLWQLPRLVQPAETGFPFVPLLSMAQRLGEVFSRGIVGWPAGLPLVLLLGSMTAGVLLARIPAVAGLVCWAAAPLLALWLISSSRPLFTERYLIWTLPAWLLLAAAGLAGLARRGWGGRLAALAGTAGLVAVGLTGVGHQWGTPIRADFRSAAAFVSQHHRVGDLIVFQIPHLQATFDYYAPGLDYRPAEGPYTNRGESASDIDAYLHAATESHPRAWLVLSEAPMWDQRGLTLDWFQTHGRPLNQATLNRVEVIQWQLDAGS